MNEMDEFKTDTEKITTILHAIKYEQAEIDEHVKALRSKMDKTNDLLTVIKKWLMFFGITTIVGIISGGVYLLYLLSL